jgi:hypothetical protein
MIIELARNNQLAAIFGERESVRAGGLMCYGASLPDMYRRAAVYVESVTWPVPSTVSLFTFRLSIALS